MKRPALILAGALFLLSLLIVSYRVVGLGYPLLPAAKMQAWRLSLDIDVAPEDPGRGRETRIAIGLPRNGGGVTVVDQENASGAFNLNIRAEGSNQWGIWSGILDRRQSIRYHATFLRENAAADVPPASGPPPADAPGSAEVQALRAGITASWKSLPAAQRILAVSRFVRGDGSGLPAETLREWRALQEKRGRIGSLLALYAAAGLPARQVRGLPLTEAVFTLPQQWIEVWNGSAWVRILPRTGEIPADGVSFVPLVIGDEPLVRTGGGEVTDLRWSLQRRVINRWQSAFEHIQSSTRFLDRWSLFSLPAQYQDNFRILLLVPIGALMIAFLRNMIGFPTFGIFMPVLLALAFRSTGVTYGLGIFSGVVFVGYLVRRLLDRFRLLLVPRLSIILTSVILTFVVVALVGSKLDIGRLMAVGLLPFVILSMTVERFFLMIEESGALKAFETAAGTAAVSAIAYEIVSIDALQLTFFVFPELLLSVAGILVLLGRYTGYRLSELLRFRDFGGGA